MLNQIVVATAARNRAQFAFAIVYLPYDAGVIRKSSNNPKVWFTEHRALAKKVEDWLQFSKLRVEVFHRSLAGEGNDLIDLSLSEIEYYQFFLRAFDRFALQLFNCLKCRAVLLITIQA